MKPEGSRREIFFNHLAQTSDAPMGLEIERASGCHLVTKSGEHYLDLISGIAVSSLGHGHPEVLKAIHEQVDRHLHVMVYGEFVQEPQVQLVRRLASQLPDSLSQIYLVNSGTEANEGALKLAKKSTGRSGLVSFHHSYHGDTHGSLSVTGRAIYRDPYQPLLPNVTFLDFNSLEELSRIDETTAAVILEPIQGEGGVIPADPIWLQAVREQCNRTGACLIFDEIQTGFGRTGTLFSFEGYGVTPDILTMAKALGGGMPIGAFAASPERFRHFRQDPPLSHVTTFGGHPVSAAAADAALRALLEEGWMDRAGKIEGLIRNRLQGKGIREVRGKGAMLGLELESAELTARVVSHGFENGLLLGWTLHSNTLIRIAPPLVITDKELHSACDVILDGIGDFQH
ncbi:MAG: aspartate aminotransferase family protein [Bacteroidota bacterium]